MRAVTKATTVLILFALISAGCSGNEQVAKPPSPASTTSPPSPSPSVKSIIALSPKPSTAAKTSPSPEAFNWATAEVNEENVREALKDNVGAAMAIVVNDDTFRKFTSSEDTKGAYVEITVNPGAFGDQKDFVKRAGGSLLAYSKVLFENPDVYEISVNALVDNVGGGENPGVYISWRRENAEGVDLDAALDNMFGEISIPYGLARKYSIQNDLYSGLKDFELPAENNL